MRPSWLRKAAAFVGAGALVASGLTVAAATVAAPPAHAEQNVVGVPASFDNAFYAYVADGEALDVDFTKFANAGTGGAGLEYRVTITDPAGNVAYTSTVGAGAAIGASRGQTGLTGPAGAWKISLTQGAGTGQSTFDWDITVRDDGGAAQAGRVWTYQYGMLQNDGVQTRDLTYTVLNDTGYRYEIDLRDYNGIGSRIIANSLGITGENDEPLYQSVNGGSLGAGYVGPQYRIFFDDPSAALPVTAPSADGELMVAPPLLTPADLAVNDLAFTPNSFNSGSGTFSYSITDRFSGAYELQIDTDGNGSYDDGVDRIIPLGADGSGSYAYDFDGLDGQGDVIADCTLMNARVFFEKLGEIHVLQVDVESRAGGIDITRLNGSNAPDSTTYWDDTALTGERANTTPVLDGTGGVNSAGGVHGWPNDGNSWGNSRTIDDWAYDPIAFSAAEISIGGRCLDIEKTSDATADTRVGDAVTYTVTATNTGELDYTDETPATVTDDLTGVLDDAMYNDDATADVDGTVSYAEPKLSWTGALPAGETVTLTYTAMLTAVGDRVVRNVAYGDSPDTPTPVCDPPTEDGTDPDTGVPCAENSFDLPRLTIEKSADQTELPAVGDTVTYTVTATNEGPGVYTEDAPAVVVDDMSEVLDDADFVDGSITTSLGDEAVFADGRLRWEGPLAVDETVTITYQVTYTAAGDASLTNVAWQPSDPGSDPEPPVCDPRNADGTDPVTGEACGTVTIPAGQYTVTKDVDPEDGSTVAAGQELTYTITFDSTGTAAADIDTWVDDLSGVLDDAEVVSAPAASNEALTVSEVEDGRFTVSGTIPQGESYTVTYTVRVLPDGERGDNSLGNVLFQDGTTPPEDCAEGDPLCTENPIPEIVDSKSVDPESGSTVQPGQDLTYTLTFTNEGTGAGTVDKVDDLTHVLDDADVTVAPTASDDALAVSEIADGSFSIAGELAAGQTVTVTYTVTVKPMDELGDTELGNFLLDPGTTPPTPSDCEPGDEDCTYNPVPRFADSKSVDPETGSVVEPGQELTYTLTFENTGTVPAAVDRVDDLTHVLDDADITTAPVASDAALAVSEITDGRFSIEGELAVGQTVTVSYTVTVKPLDELGDTRLANFLLDPTDPTPEDPSDCVAGDEDCTDNTVPRLEDSKSVDPESGSTVDPGQELTYTLTFENTGSAPATVDRVDDLTHVLDDADVTTAPVASDEALTVSAVEAGRVSIAGTVEPGQTVTVSYTVTVKAADALGDRALANFLLDPTDPTPEDPDDCVDGGEDCTFNPVPDVVDSKSVDPESGTTVQPGQELTYTLTFENIGEAAGEVDRVDDLTHVLDDADVTTLPVASDDALTVSEIADGRFSIAGELAAGQTVTVTYAVTVKAADELGDTAVANFLLDPGTPPPSDPSDCDVDCTYNPVPEIVDSKSVDPASSTAVRSGQELTYTLTFENTGEAAGSVDRVDDLTHVLDDADVTTAPVASDAALTVSEIAEGRLAITGELQPGQTATVTYAVTVKHADALGDSELANFLLDPEEEPPSEPVCTDGEDCTYNPVSDVVVTKTADPASGTEVAVGQEIGYTLTFENAGSVAESIDYTDHMDGVLDDADLTGAPVASDEALTVSAMDDGAFSVAGELAAGQTVSVTYTVKVRDWAEQEDHTLGNVVAVTGQEPPADCSEGSMLCTEHPIEEPPAPAGPPSPPLAATGADIANTVLLSLLGMLILGGGAILVGRGRRGRAPEGDEIG